MHIHVENEIETDEKMAEGRDGEYESERRSERVRGSEKHV